MKVGDVVTITGVVQRYPNPKWRWWTFWRDKWIVTKRLVKFRVVAKL